MFTFGREHEVNVALRRHGGPERAVMIVDIVNSIHDLLEKKTTLDHVENRIISAVIEGKRDIWDAAGTWLLKLQKDYPSVAHIWADLTTHPKSEVRFRVAAHIVDIPNETREIIYGILKNDKSKRVREHAEGKWDFCQHPEKYS